MDSKPECRQTVLRDLDKGHPKKVRPQRSPVRGAPNTGAVKQCGVSLMRRALEGGAFDAAMFEGTPDKSAVKQRGAPLIRHPKK
eukprot:4812922-Pyramimonas_sp.AAC.1